MRWLRRQSGWVLLGIGLLIGLVLGGLWPRSPLHAAATDRAENLVMTTAVIDQGVEAVFVLDAMTGTLRGAAPGKKMGFQSFWEYNVGPDILAFINEYNAGLKAGTTRRGGPAARPEIQVPQTPKYLLASGLADIPLTGAREKPAASLLYVTEANTGVGIAYMIPWSGPAHSAGQPYKAGLTRWGAAPFTSAVIRAEE